MATGKRKDPYLGFNFQIEIQGLVVGGFMEVSGLQLEIQIKEYQEGGQNAFVHKLPGPARFPGNLTLKRGLSDSDLLWDWQSKVAAGNIQRRNGSVILLDETGVEKLRWNFFNAYPVRWNGPQFNAETASVAFETLELAHTGIQQVRR
ncbi:MAG: phage tail protein [Anaerolineae bacterium]|nr:phage tail protein [Anaerolineae bacterium]